MVRANGAYERILEDSNIGWHAGNWDVNCRSVAICLDGDYRETDPSPEMVTAVARIIRGQYPDIQSEKVIGHNEVINTACPGKNFITGWKKKIVSNI